jgi:CelD/BcsL family acetyltransferase involved in cellulose biosynthesis
MGDYLVEALRESREIVRNSGEGRRRPNRGNRAAANRRPPRVRYFPGAQPGIHRLSRVVGLRGPPGLPGRERRRARHFEALVEAVFAARKEWDCIELADLSEESAAPGLLEEQARRRKFRLAEGAGQVCPCVPLAPSWNELLKIVKEKKRSAIKWRRKKLLQAYPTQFQIFSDPAQVDAALETLARLHTLSRQRKNETGNFYRADYQAFHRDVAHAMARAGYLYIAQMDCDGRPVASTYGFHVGSVLFDYQKGYDPAYSRDGVGSVLTGMVIEDAIERLHAQELDFLRGTEEYKYFWATRDRKTRTILVWSAGMMARLHQSEFDLRRTLAPLKRKGVEFWARITAPKPAKKPEAPRPSRRPPPHRINRSARRGTRHLSPRTRSETPQAAHRISPGPFSNGIFTPHLFSCTPVRSRMAPPRRLSGRTIACTSGAQSK